MNWYEDWFDSPLYEKLYANRNEDEARRLVSFINRCAPPQHFPKLLDLGCGRGRHSVNLAQCGYDVTGVDLSPEAIKKAEMRAAKEKLENVRFQIQDMRRNLGKEFDVIVNLFTSFGYFEEDEENEKVIANIAAMLRPGGIAFIDFMNAGLARKQLIEQEAGALEDLEYEINREATEDSIIKSMRFQEPGSKEFFFQEKVKSYDVEWFRKCFSKYGLHELDLFGDYDGNPFNSDTSPRLFLMVEKLPE